MDFNDIMDFNNIAAMLRDGLSPNEIAEAFTNVLNMEIKAYDEELSTPQTKFEILLKDLEADYYDDEYFEDWSFKDYTDLLSYIWNRVVIAYNAENNCTLEDLYLSEEQVHNFVKGFLGLYNSPTRRKINEVAAKMREACFKNS